MEPPETAAPELCVVTKEPVDEVGDCGHVNVSADDGVDTDDVVVVVLVPVADVGARGRISNERVRRHELRTIRHESEWIGSCVDV